MAKELFITQQAISRIIKNLEKEVGVSLFYRDSKGVYPTGLGKYILPKAKVLVKEFEKFVEEINDMVKKKN